MVQSGSLARPGWTSDLMAVNDMGLLAQRNPPNLPSAPKEYDQQYMDQLNKVLRLWFEAQNAVQQISIAGLNIDTSTLPTEAALATLRVGDVYRDSTADNVLKVKV